MPVGLPRPKVLEDVATQTSADPLAKPRNISPPVTIPMRHQGDPETIASSPGPSTRDEYPGGSPPVLALPRDRRTCTKVGSLSRPDPLLAKRGSNPWRLWNPTL